MRHLGEHEWTVLTLPARHFRWRIRGNPVSWWLSESEALSQSYDLVLATSMVDCATVKGLFPHLSQCRWVAYFHENQLAYPVSGEQHGSVDPAMVNLYSAMACDRVMFNSDYNRQSFLDGLDQLVKRLPDQVNSRVVDFILAKSVVIPVPLAEDLLTYTNSNEAGRSVNRNDPLTVVWNHRVEYDKGLEELYAIVTELVKRTQEFRLVLLGRRFRQQPEIFDRLCNDYRRFIVKNGFAESRQEYLDWLQQSDVALSTAIHEFQGLSVMEAVALGCRPVVPDRLSYPELFPGTCRYSSVASAADMILSARKCTQEQMLRYNWQHLSDVYRREISALLD